MGTIPPRGVDSTTDAKQRERPNNLISIKEEYATNKMDALKINA
jgi:hypothetical protein